MSGAKQALNLLPKYVAVDSVPQPATEVLVSIAIGEGWCGSRTEALDLASRLLSGFLRLVGQEIEKTILLGRFLQFALNTSDRQLLQGSCFVEPPDSPGIRKEKEARRRSVLYVAAFADLSPDDFEALCAGFCSLIGIKKPVLTKSSRDEGIDFYGVLDLMTVMHPEKLLPGFDRQLAFWVIGQAKHHKLGQVNTLEIRDLVGAVQLAKSRAFGSGGEDKYVDLKVRVCDPVMYLFATTGGISADGWRLLTGSGVLGVDGAMLAAFLAERCIALDTSGVFSMPLFKSWVEQHKRKP
jgi:hypothetical protein